MKGKERILMTEWPAIFDKIDIIWKYLINGVLFGFVYEGWWHFYQKGVFSKEKILSLFKKKDSSK